MLTISIDPVAFSLGTITVRWYGIMVTLAVVAVLAITLRETKRLGVPQDFLLSLFLWGIIGGFLGGRLVHLIDYWNYYIAHPTEVFGTSGLALYGTVLGAILAAWIYMRVRKRPFRSLDSVAEAIAVGAPLGQAIGRIGCTLNGCCFGKLSPFTSFPGAVIYSPRDTIPPQYWGVPLYPVQLYFVAWNLVVFAIVWKLRGRLKPQGSLFLLYLCLYAIGDFGLRFFRYADTCYLLGLQQGQIISLVILAIALPLLIIRMHRFQPEVAAEARE